MAYNKVGTPSFFIDYFQHWNTMGMIDGIEELKNISITDLDDITNDNPINMIGLNPTNNIWFEMNSLESGGTAPYSKVSINFNKSSPAFLLSV